MPDNEVKIVVNADDKASAVFQGLSRNMSKAVDAVAKLTDGYMEYGDQVEDMSTFTRMSSEETSRMIQMAKGAEVEYGTLSMAMKGMVQNGVQPNIDKLAMLSDQFLAIRDPLAQSQFLIDNFGRSGQDMAKIMEQGGMQIRQMAADTAAGLIIDEQKAAALDATDKALIAFNKSMDEMKNEAAGQLLGIFQQMPAPLQQVTLGIGSMVQGGMLNDLADLAIIFGKVGGTSTALTATGTALQGVAVGTWAAVGPVLAVAAALTAAGIAIYKLVEFFGMLGQMMDQLAAKGLVGEFLSKIFNFYELAGAMDLNASMQSLGLPGRASGGPVSGGRPYMVGENGPELMIPGSSGTILPNGSSFGGGGGAVVINNYNVTYAPFMSTMDKMEMETKLQPIFDRLLRSARR